MLIWIFIDEWILIDKSNAKMFVKILFCRIFEEAIETGFKVLLHTRYEELFYFFLNTRYRQLFYFFLHTRYRQLFYFFLNTRYGELFYFFLHTRYGELLIFFYTQDTEIHFLFFWLTGYGQLFSFFLHTRCGQLFFQYFFFIKAAEVECNLPASNVRKLLAFIFGNIMGICM